jgi:hypothetical protein
MTHFPAIAANTHDDDCAPRRQGLSRRRFLMGTAAALAVEAATWVRPPIAVTAAVAARRARPADTLAETLGVVVVTSTRRGVWGNRAMVKSRLQELGVRYARNRLFAGNKAQLGWIRELAKAGVRFNLVMGDPTTRGGTPEQLVKLAANELPGAVASFEGANEWNLKGRPGWVKELRAHQTRLYKAAKANPRTSNIPVLGPSLGRRKDHKKLGNLTSVLDLGNNHLYTGGYVPSYRVDEELAAARTVSGSRPVVVTETGWHNARYSNATHNYTSEAAAGVYAPRLLLEYYLRDVPRIYVFHLVNDKWDPGLKDHEAHFGLLRYDFSKKPAFIALRNLMRLVDDPGRSFKTGSLDYELRNAPRDLRQVLVQRRDGTFVLFLWRDVAIWDPKAERSVSVKPVKVTLKLARSSDVRLHRPSSSSRPVASTFGATSPSVQLDGEVVAVVINPR